MFFSLLTDKTQAQERKPMTGSIYLEGILNHPGPSICMQGDYELHDCQGNIIVRIDSGSLGGLDSFVGRYVRIVAGQDIGVECPVFTVNKIFVLPNRC
jgi:hypothetical protein